MLTKVRIARDDNEFTSKIVKCSQPLQLFCEIAVSCPENDNYCADIIWLQKYSLGNTPVLPEMVDYGYGYADLRVLISCLNCFNYFQVWPIDSFIGYVLYCFSPTLPFFVSRLLKYLISNNYLTRYPSFCCPSPDLRLFFHLKIINFGPEHLRFRNLAQQILKIHPSGI